MPAHSTASRFNNDAVMALESLLRDALRLRASDIHLEYQANALRIRCRIDGRLHDIPPPSDHLRDALVSRIKVLSRMDIADKRLPQDGRFRHVHDGRSTDCRVSSLPTTGGEKLVIRLLNLAQERPSLAALGYGTHEEQQLLQALNRPHGLILMTGPTGSGKTLSLYSSLDVLNTPQRNLSTVEDPVEIDLPGVNQVNIHERAGLTFAHALRALLRQDPDVLMVGEIRDSETALVSIQAAQTGHLVLSTLHTPDAPSALARLRHMGIPLYHLAASISLVTAQRLVRRLCPHCKQTCTAMQQQNLMQHLSDIDRQVLSQALRRDNPLYVAHGCNMCHEGYLGRTGIYQIMPMSPALQHLVVQDATPGQLSDQAHQEGMLTLRQAGWRLVLNGLTSVDEIMSSTLHA